MALYREFQTREEIDAQYDVERAVPDFMVYARQYLDSSAEARRALEGHYDVRYGPTVAEHIDVFPAARPNAPVLLFYHGGYWRILAARDFSFVARGPVLNGVTTMVVNYALCPTVTVDEITRQARAAAAWAHANARRFNGDPGRLYAAGHSAGGQMVAELLLTRWREDYGLPDDIVRGGFAISGVFDLRPVRHSSMQPQIRLDDGIVERNSPQFHVRRVRPPLLTAVGGDETSEFHRQTDDFIGAWRAAGNRAESLPMPGANHFTAISPFWDPDSPMMHRLNRFMGHQPPTGAAPGSYRRDFGRMPSSGLGRRGGRW
jgi:arylformamidase